MSDEYGYYPEMKREEGTPPISPSMTFYDQKLFDSQVSDEFARFRLENMRDLEAIVKKLMGLEYKDPVTEPDYDDQGRIIGYVEKEPGGWFIPVDAEGNRLLEPKINMAGAKYLLSALEPCCSKNVLLGKFKENEVYTLTRLKLHEIANSLYKNKELYGLKNAYSIREITLSNIAEFVFAAYTRAIDRGESVEISKIRREISSYGDQPKKGGWGLFGGGK